MTFSKENFMRLEESAKHSLEYKHYLETREAVFTMMENEPRDTFSEPSKYWQEELSGFEYMLDASALLIKKLRHHCYHLTGVRDWEYRMHHAYHTLRFENLLKRLQKEDKNGVLVPESPKLGGFGYTIDGSLYNNDTLRFYDAMLSLNRAGGLEQFRNSKKRGVVAEVGAGWGGFAYQFKTLFQNTSYVIVDFPSTILFSGTYLKTVFPNARTLFITSVSECGVPIEQYDFVFVPHYLWPSLSFKRPDILINLASFQEMKTKQMEEYIQKALRWGIPSVFSVNHERNFSNPEMEKVSVVLKKYYPVREVGMSHPPSAYSKIKSAYRELKDALKILLRRSVKISKHSLYGSM